MHRRRHRSGEFVRRSLANSERELAYFRRGVFSDESPVIAETGECIDWARSQDVWYGTMPNWDTSLVEDMSGYDGGFQGFGGKSTFNGDISKWNTAKVTTMYYMFYSASAFNQDIGSWNTAKVTTMYICFIPLLRSTKTLGVGTQRK